MEDMKLRAEILSKLKDAMGEVMAEKRNPKKPDAVAVEVKSMDMKPMHDMPMAEESSDLDLDALIAKLLSKQPKEESEEEDC